MLSACAFTVFLFDPSYPALHLFPSAVFRRTLMGVAMGVTVILIIRSPMGKRFGAHFNPAITFDCARLPDGMHCSMWCFHLWAEQEWPSPQSGSATS
jgi:hypothetical protein